MPKPLPTVSICDYGMPPWEGIWGNPVTRMRKGPTDLLVSSSSSVLFSLLLAVSHPLLRLLPISYFVPSPTFFQQGAREWNSLSVRRIFFSSTVALFISRNSNGGRSLASYITPRLTPSTVFFRRFKQRSSASDWEAPNAMEENPFSAPPTLSLAYFFCDFPPARWTRGQDETAFALSRS